MGFTKMYQCKITNPEDNAVIETAASWLAKMGYIKPDPSGVISTYSFTKFCILCVTKNVLEKVKEEMAKYREVVEDDGSEIEARRESGQPEQVDSVSEDSA